VKALPGGNLRKARTLEENGLCAPTWDVARRFLSAKKFDELVLFNMVPFAAPSGNGDVLRKGISNAAWQLMDDLQQFAISLLGCPKVVGGFGKPVRDDPTRPNTAHPSSTQPTSSLPRALSLIAHAASARCVRVRRVAVTRGHSCHTTV